MNIVNTCLVSSGIALSLLITAPAYADGDHGTPAPATQTGTQTLPRFHAESDQFELVGVINGKEVTLYLDHYADGSPVTDATLDLTFDGTRIPVALHGEGEFEATLADIPAPGEITITATVTSGGESSLMTGELNLHEARADTAVSPTPQYLIGLGVMIAIIAVLAGFIRRTTRQQRPTHAQPTRTPQTHTRGAA